MADISLYQYLFIPFLAVISANITPTDILCISCMNSFFLSFRVGELGAIFTPSKLHLEALNTFTFIWPSGYCACVLPLLSFYIACFCYFSSLSTGAYWSLMSIWYYFTPSSCLMYSLLSAPMTFLTMNPSWSFISSFLRNCQLYHCAYPMNSHIVPLRYILLPQFFLLLPHIMWYHNFPSFRKTMITHPLVSCQACFRCRIGPWLILLGFIQKLVTPCSFMAIFPL